MLALPLLLIIAGGGYYFWSTQGSGQAPKPGISVTRPDTQAGAGRATRPLDELRRDWFVTYKPMPDTRFLEAYRLLLGLDGKKIPATEVSLQDGDWQIHVRGQKPITLTEGASFEEQWEYVAAIHTPPPNQGAVQREQAEDPLAAIRPVIAMFWAPTQLEAISLLHNARNQLADKSEYFHLMAQALLNLSLQASDRSELRDGLFSRALMAAVAAEGEGAEISHLKTLLAWSLGYEDAARRMAVGLHQNDPVRELVSGNWKAFRDTAFRDGSAIRARYLALNALATRHADGQTLRRTAAKLFPGTDYTPAISSLLYIPEDNSVKRRAAIDANASILQEMHLESGGDEARAPRGTPEAVANFEQMLAAIPSSEDPLAPQTITRQYWQQAFWNSLWVWSQTLTEDPTALRDFAERLSGQGKLAQQFRTLQQATANNDLNASTLSSVIQDLDALPWSMQATPLLRMASATPSGRSALRLISQRGDERPEHLAAFGLLAQNILLDRERADAFFNRALEIAPISHSLLEPRIAATSNNIPRLRAMLGERDRPAPIRRMALLMLQRSGQATSADGHTLYDGLLQEQPNNTDLHARATAYFEESGDYDAAGRGIEAWIAATPEGSAQRREALLAKARLMHKSNQSAAAWQLIEPLIDPEGEDSDARSLDLAARIAFAAKQPKAALRLALAAYSNYRSIDSLLLNVELLWHLECNTSTKLLLNHGPEVTWQVWRERIGPLFAKTFKGRPEAAQKCITALLSQPVFPYNLAHFGLGIAANSEPPPAYTLKLVEFVKPEDFGGPEIQLEGFSLVERMQGFEAALEWLKQRFKGQQLTQLPDLFYIASQDALLWRFFDNPKAANLVDRVWLLRAAAMVRDGDPNHPKLDELKAYYRSSGNDLDHLIGRYLTGYGDKNSLNNRAKNSTESGRIAYYLGLKAAAEQRLQDAATWMQVSRETGASASQEYIWAGQWLKSRFPGL
jgi:hypothetical protein